jgi:hypothetical protein
VDTTQFASPSSGFYVGANIYYWGDAEMRRLLLEGLRPWTVAARSRGLAHHLWWSRFDIRGPHMVALFSTTVERQPALCRFLNRRISDFLLRSPSNVELSAEVLEERHRRCKGKAICVAEQAVGLAPNNSFLLFTQADTEYPISLFSDLQDKKEFWRYLDALAFWAIERAQGRIVETAIRWLATVDRALRCHRVPAEDYWCFHSTTLFVYPNHKSWESRRGELQQWLPRAISEKNKVVFADVWSGIRAGEDLGFDVNGLIETALANDGRSWDRRFLLLREINHQLFLQLGLMVKFAVPLILYAWHRSLRE